MPQPGYRDPLQQTHQVDTVGFEPFLNRHAIWLTFLNAAVAAAGPGVSWPLPLPGKAGRRCCSNRFHFVGRSLPALPRLIDECNQRGIVPQARARSNKQNRAAKGLQRRCHQGDCDPVDRWVTGQSGDDTKRNPYACSDARLLCGVALADGKPRVASPLKSRPRNFTCAECVRLSAETSALLKELAAAREHLRRTPTTDPAHAERKREWDRLRVRYRAARQREDAHRVKHGYDPGSLLG
jgi:hypothetical protein